MFAPTLLVGIALIVRPAMALDCECPGGRTPKYLVAARVPLAVLVLPPLAVLVLPRLVAQLGRSSPRRLARVGVREVDISCIIIVLGPTGVVHRSVKWALVLRLARILVVPVPIALIILVLLPACRLVVGTACCEASRCCPRCLSSALVPVVWRFTIPVLLPLPVRNISVRCALCSWDSVLLERGFLLLGGSITPSVGCPAVAVLAVLFLRTVVASLIVLIVGLPFSLRGSSSFAGRVLWIFALFAISGRRRFAICCLSCFALCVLRGFRFLLLPPLLLFLSFLPLSRSRLFVVVGIVITVVAVIAAFFRLILQERLSVEETHSETNSLHLDPREDAPPFSDELNAPRFELPVRLFQLWARLARAHCRCWHSDAGGVHQVRGQVHFAITRPS